MSAYTLRISQIFLLIFGYFLAAGAAFAQTQYCAQRTVVSPGTQCFATQAEAETYLRAEYTPEYGSKFLNPVSVTQLSPGYFSIKYEVGLRKYESFFGDWYTGEVIGPGNGSSCNLNPIPISAGMYGCEDEASLAPDILDSYPHGGPGWTGRYVGSYSPMPPAYWYLGGHSATTDRDYVAVHREMGPSEDRRLFISTLNGSDVFQTLIRRRDYYECPKLFVAKQPGATNAVWPMVCHNGAFGYISKQSNQYNSCAKDGNPCVAATGNKEYRETDFEWEGLSFTRAYNSVRDLPLMSGMGDNWAHSFSDRILLRSNVTTDMYWLRSDGYFEVLVKITETTYKSLNDVGVVLYKEPDAVAATHGRWRIAQGNKNTLWFDEGGRLSYIESGSQTFKFSYCSDPNFSAQLCAARGALTEVVSASGRKLEFEHVEIAIPVGTQGDVRVETRVQRIKSGGAVLAEYAFDPMGRLTVAEVGGSAQGSTHEYIYAESANLCRDGAGAVISGCDAQNYPHHLTGVVDEMGARFATYSYDNYGRVTSSQHSGETGKVSLLYLANGGVDVTLPTGAKRAYQFTSGAFRKPVQIQMSATDGSVTGTTADTYANMRLASRVSSTGSKTIYGYDTFHEISRTDGLTASGSITPQSRTVQTDWHPDRALPVERRIYDSANTLVGKSSWVYNARGQALTSTQINPATSTDRISTTNYCEAADVTVGTCPRLGLVTSIDGPRTDVSDTAAYTYYATDDATCASSPTICPHRKGDLWKVTDALGRITETLTYDGAGRPLSVKDANGIVTDMEYHARGWLIARKVRGTNNAVEIDDQITQIEYWPTGLVKKVTQPDGAFTAYTYDAAHRLTDIADNAGNTIHYTLDNAGNRTAEATKDSGSTLRRSLSRVYNQLGQLQTAKDAYNHATGFTYDANGNNQVVTDALNRVTDNDYDPLNRLARTLQDVGGIAAETKFEYDALDNLTKVTDPKGLDTTYQYNGFGDLTQLASPDTGTTLYTYDSAGNRKTQTDARGIVSTYSYDALNRLTGIAYPTSSLNVGYLYDTANPVCTTGETFAIGRLSQMTDSSGDTQYCYDRFGNLTRKVQTTNGHVFELRYAYTLAGQLQAITYPDGAIVDYVRDGQGRITEVGATPAGGVRTILLNQATYHPFGPVAGWVYGNGRTMSRPLNQNYQPTAVADNATGGLSLGYEFDAVGNLSNLYNADQSVTKAQYGYDALNRLADVKDGPTDTVIEHYGYDATGNRTSFTNAGGTTSYTYPTTNHRLTQVGATARSYDNTGNTIQIGGTAKEFVYNDAGRMSQVKASGTATMNYQLNGRGEQVRKYLNTNNTYTVYDEAGRWIGDYDNAGNAIQQVIWLDDLPVGLLASNQLKYLQSDHLGTPRAVIDPITNAVIWRWDLEGEAFGNTVPNQDPDGNGIPFVLNMRFPGQRYDAASGLNYNYHRNYDFSVGRYTQADPLGLMGGLDRFGYAGAGPLNWIDLFGLEILGMHSSAQINDPSPASGHSWIGIYGDDGRLMETWGAWQRGHRLTPPDECECRATDLYQDIEKNNADRYVPQQSFYIKLTPVQLARFRSLTKKSWNFGAYRSNCAAWVDTAFEATFPGSSSLVTDPMALGATTPRALSGQLKEWNSQYPGTSIQNPLNIK